MKRKIIIIIISFLLSDFLLPITCVGSCFEVTLEKDSMYTPNDSQLRIRLTEEAKIEGNYHVRVTVTIGDTVVLKQTSALEKQQDATYKLEFPSLERKTTAKCYVELLVDEVFLEGKTQPITLWPPYKGFEIKTGSKKIWVYDPSKSLTAIFEKAGVKTLDATFQAVRDFGEPNIVFIGQEIDPNQITAFTYRLSEVRAKAVIIYLKQSQLPKNSRIEIPAADNKANNIICDMNSPFLQGLDEMDILNLLGRSGCLRIAHSAYKAETFRSYVTEQKNDTQYLYSYLLLLKSKQGITIYCQLPISTASEPRTDTLLSNLLKIANEVSDSETGGTFLF